MISLQNIEGIRHLFWLTLGVPDQTFVTEKMKKNPMKPSRPKN